MDKFKPGDRAQLVLSPNIVVHILERVEVECHGGIQTHYKCRAGRREWGVAGASFEILTFQSIELEPLSSAGDARERVTEAAAICVRLDLRDIAIELTTLRDRIGPARTAD